jgi:hypothetical protein
LKTHPHHFFWLKMSHRDDMKISIIFWLHSTTSSHTRKIIAPSFLAIEIAYFEFNCLSSSLSTGFFTMSQLMILGSIEEQSLIKKIPSERALSLNELIFMSGTLEFAQLRMS